MALRLVDLLPELSDDLTNGFSEQIGRGRSEANLPVVVLERIVAVLKVVLRLGDDDKDDGFRDLGSPSFIKFDRREEGTGGDDRDGI